MHIDALLDSCHHVLLLNPMGCFEQASGQKCFCGKVTYTQTICVDPQTDECLGEGAFTCCATVTQCCCCVDAVACPPNNDVPAAIACFGVFCYGAEHYGPSKSMYTNAQNTFVQA